MLVSSYCAELAAVHVGQADVEDDQVVVLLRGLGQPVGAVGRLEHVELLGQQPSRIVLTSRSAKLFLQHGRGRAMANQSLLERMNLPDGFGYALLMVALILTLAPWLRGSDFGLFKIPDFAPATRRALIVIGPLALLLAVGLHLPMQPRSSPDTAQSDPGNDDPPPVSEYQRVLADWQENGCLYPARLLKMDGGSATLEFDFGARATVPAGEVFASSAPDVEIGRSAFAKLPAREGWVPITIRDTRSRNVQVERDAAAACAAEFGKSIQWVPIDTLIAAKPIGDAP
jgi:hypothetical protein